MTDNKVEILERILEVRVDSGLSSKDFATKANIDPSNYSSIENGKRPLGKRVINDICRAFNVNVSWLMSGRGNKYNEPIPQSISPQPDSISVPREVWKVIEDQAASLRAKDEQMNKMLANQRMKDAKKDDQMSEMISLLRKEIERGAENAEGRGDAAPGAAIGKSPVP